VTDSERESLIKVPAVTLGFWIIKILATTLGETGGDTVSMTYTDMVGLSHDAGYLIGTAIFLPLLAILVWFQIRAKAFRPFLYWTTIIASTTAGTTMADFATRSMGIGYAGGSALLLGLVLASLALWHKRMGSISVGKQNSTIGSRSRSHRLWARLSAIGLLMTSDLVWAIQAQLLFLRSVWQRSRRSISGPSSAT
jgi:uncharacterized membrane-anchored protein